MNIQGWFSLGLTGLISLQSKGLSRVFSSTTVQKHQFFSAQPSLWSNSDIHNVMSNSQQQLREELFFTSLTLFHSELWSAWWKIENVSKRILKQGKTDFKASVKHNLRALESRRMRTEDSLKEMGFDLLSPSWASLWTWEGHCWWEDGAPVLRRACGGVSNRAHLLGTEVGPSRQDIPG